VAADLRLVADAADRDALELAPQRFRDRAPEARLPHPGRADEAEDRAGRVRVQFAHREVLEDPLLDVFEVVVVGVQHPFGVADVEVVGRLLGPGQLDQPLQVGADDAVLGRRGRQFRQPPELPVGRFARLLGQPGRLDFVLQFFDFGDLLVLFAELVLDRFQLLAEEELALAFVDFGLDLGLDLGAELDHFQLAGEDLREVAQPFGDVDFFQQLLLLGGLDPQRPGDQVGERARVVDVGDGQLQLLRQVGDLLDDLREGALDVAAERLQFGARFDLVGHLGDPGDEVGAVADVVVEAHALGRLDEDPQRPVRHFHHPLDHADDAHLVEVVGGRLLQLRVLGGDHHQHPIAAEDVVDQLDRARLADRQRGDRVREGDRVAQRQDRQRLGQRQRAVAQALIAVERGFDDLQRGGRGLHQVRSIGTWCVVSCGSRSGSSMVRMPSS
jgi:hypothetical protein